MTEIENKIIVVDPLTKNPIEIEAPLGVQIIIGQKKFNVRIDKEDQCLLIRESGGPSAIRIEPLATNAVKIY